MPRINIPPTVGLVETKQFVPDQKREEDERQSGIEGHGVRAPRHVDKKIFRCAGYVEQRGKYTVCISLS